ncbi:MAG TPA: hypothetical protein VFE36_04655 [Candidatus Baltobacteraceae bacterium]|jgi:hypothetical protein|nr:hypothetical protein [Candidatus Baltobacteraceae bacterium]
MNEQLEQVPLSEDLLIVMRNSGRYAQQLREPFITARALLLALLDDQHIGPTLAEVVPREKLTELEPVDDARTTAARLPESDGAEKSAMPRYDTLAFKLPEGTASAWLSREAYTIFVEGANRAEETYLPKHLAFGLAAEALRSPGVLAALRVEPGKITDALFQLG